MQTQPTLQSVVIPINYIRQNTRAYDLDAIAEGFITDRPNTFFSTALNSFVTYNESVGIYTEISKEQLASMIQEYIRIQGYIINNAGQVDSAVKFISRRPEFRQTYKFNYDKYKFAVRNCIIDCSNGGIPDILPHSPDYYSTIMYDVTYDSDAVATTFIRILKEILPNTDKQKFIMNWLAYCLLPTYEYQKILLQYGSGRNGKGLIWTPISAMLGTHFTSLSTHAISTREFMLSSLKDKLVNFSSEQKIGTVELDILKLLSGGDKITADRKFQPDPVEFNNKARLIMSTNTLPRFNEINDSVTERFWIIEFNEKFVGNQVDSGLAIKLVTEEEKSGILNMLLGIMPTIFKEGSVYFDAPAIINEETRKGFNEISGLGDFIDECLIIGRDKSLAKDVFARYLQYCNDTNMKALSKREFNKLLLATNSTKIFKDKGAGNQTTFFGVHILK